jgi:hypothetical protein
VETKTTESTSALGAPDVIKGPPKPLTFDTKPYDPHGRPFHRVRARTYDRGVDDAPQATMTLTPPSGKGYDCGCRSPNDYRHTALFAAVVGAAVDGLIAAVDAEVPGAQAALDAMSQASGTDIVEELKQWLANTMEGAFFRSYLRYVPSWAPVDRIGYGPQFRPETTPAAPGAHNVVNGREAEVEVEGVLSRSYMTRHHRAYTQWSNFYHWSFQLLPERGFKHLIGAGDLLTPNERDDLKDRAEAIELYLNSAMNSSFECLFDLGALSKPPGDQKPVDVRKYPSILFSQKWPFWPQSGDWFWAAGRYVYDCTHATDDDKQKGLHPTLINPTKAFAVARYEAFHFEEVGEWIPATRFFFLATSKGGYWNFDGDIKITDQNYEFVVDLPSLPDDIGEFSIGRTPEFDWNTIVVRPRLLKKIELAPFGLGAESPLKWWKRDPILQLVRPEPGKLPRQLRIKVPLSEMKAEDGDAYGFVVNVGWYDPAQAARVRKVAVQLPKLTMLGERKDLRFHVCINGRWIFPNLGTNPDTTIGSVADNMQQPTYPGSEGLILHLPDDGRISITASGTQRHGYGEFMETTVSIDNDHPEDDRQLRLGGIIEVDDDLLDDIRDAIEQQLHQHIPEEYWDDLPNLDDLLDDDGILDILNSASQDLFGHRHVVVWKTEVDAIEADPTRAHVTASGITREMKVFPLAFVNKQNEPMGLVDHRLTVSIPDTKLAMKNLIRLADEQNQPVTTREYRTRKAKQSTDSGFMSLQVNASNQFGRPDHEDYVLECKVTVSPPGATDDPKPR